MGNGAFIGEDYFEHLLEEIREIRLSEHRFYQKITDIYATRMDYDSKSPISKLSGREILQNAGSVLASDAKDFALSEFEKYRITQDKLYKSDFDKLWKQKKAINNLIHKEEKYGKKFGIIQQYR